VISGEALAGMIYWMSRVVTDSQGVRIGGEVVTTNKAIPRRRFRIEEGQVHWEGGDTEPSLPIDSGALNVSGIVKPCSIRVDGDVVTLEPCKEE
jgi:hypothetical protein